MLRSLREAPVDDEPLTEGELRALKAAKADVAAGRTTSLEAVAAELGIDLSRR